MSTLRERLLAKCEPVTESGCWIWIGATRPNGYGIMSIPLTRRIEGAHRISYRIFRGPIPDGYVICHTCDVPQCVNPAHLFAATQLENIADSMRKGRLARLSSDQIRKVRDLLASGMTQEEVGRTVGISRSRARYWGVPKVRGHFRTIRDCGVP
jgi:HNH endonuclease